MQLINLTFRVLAVALFSLPVGVYASSWSCSHGNDVREVHVVRTSLAQVPCHVLYKKLTEGAEDQVLWEAQNQEGYCEDKAKAFVAKLEGWGWVCAETISDETAPEAGTGDEAGAASGSDGDEGGEMEGDSDPQGGSDEGAE